MTQLASAVLLGGLLLLAGCSEPCALATGAVDLASLLCRAVDHPQNPLIQPAGTEFLIGDPTVLPPAEAPDRQWHLYANGLKGIYHFTSPDGVRWSTDGQPLFGFLAFRPYLVREGPAYHLFFEKFSSLTSSTIQAARSHDLVSWSAPRQVLAPELPWEKEGSSTVGNPFVVQRDGVAWLYYSASTVWLADAAVYEPKYIGVARSSTLEGPFTRQPAPLVGPRADDPLHNLGAGSIKLLDRPLGGKLVALNNGIYVDGAGKSRSAIAVLSSSDGLAWSPVCPSALLAPTDSGWKGALVYGFDSVFVGKELRIYYNARDSWNPGTERIGLSTVHLPCAPP